jgi:hypothetical protein
MGESGLIFKNKNSEIPSPFEFVSISIPVENFKLILKLKIIGKV